MSTLNEKLGTRIKKKFYDKPMIDRCKLCVVTVTCDSWYKENNSLPQLIGLNRKQILNYSNNIQYYQETDLYLCEQSKITPNLNLLFIKCKNLFCYIIISKENLVLLLYLVLYILQEKE